MNSVVENLMFSIDQFEAALSADPDAITNCIQEFYYVKEDQKTDALIKYLQRAKDEQGKFPRVAVFCNDTVFALKLTLALNYSKIEALPVCETALNQFNNDEVSVLFITDELENLPEIDYSKFDVLLNFDFPKNVETYLKRLSNVCVERGAKYITYAVPETDNKLLHEITTALGINAHNIFESLTSFSTKAIPLPCAMPFPVGNYATNAYHRQPYIQSFEADITEIESTSDDDMNDDSNESIVIRAANVVGEEIQGVLGDIINAGYDEAKIIACLAFFSVVVYIITYPFARS